MIEQTLLAYEQTDYKFSDITINIGVYSDAVKQLLIILCTIGGYLHYCLESDGQGGL